MLLNFLNFSLSAFAASVSYSVFSFIVVPVGVICLFAIIIRMLRRVY